MTAELWVVYLAAAVGLSLTPGPNGLLSLTHGACFGFRPTVATVLGGALGFFVLIAASLAGMGALLAASEQAFTLAKWIGAAYLVYLGVRVWRAPAPVVAPAPAAEGGPAARPLRMFAQGFLVAVSNPKGLIFFAAFLPQFIVPGVPFAVQLAVFGGTFVAVEVVYELLLAGLAQRIAPWLSRHGRWFNRAAGATFVGLGAALTGANR
ncbi:MAG TPA: LysE family transporter [Microvirga sp.]|jgi:threonine/homoserine/homoserine lactone efflux protein|nr:LysE family transporter [Microvirga sp.]